MKRLNVLAIMLIVTGIAWGQNYKRLEQQAQKGEATARELYMLRDHPKMWISCRSKPSTKKNSPLQDVSRAVS